MSAVAASEAAPPEVAPPPGPPRPEVRRVRHEVRDGLAVMVFSALASVALAVAFTVVSALVAGIGQ